MAGSRSALPASSRPSDPRWALRRRKTAPSAARRPQFMPEQLITPSTSDRTADDYKSGVKPTWCPGCGDFGVLNAVYNSLRTKGYAPQDVVLVSGIGCSSRL